MGRTVIARVRRASTALFLVHVVRTLLACLLIVPLAPLLAPTHENEAELAAHAMDLLPSLLPFALVALSAHVIFAPYLHQALLACMEGSALRAASAHAARRYPRALALGLGRWIALGAVSFGAFELLSAAPAFAPSLVSPAGLLAVSLLAALVLLSLATLHDLLAAHLSRHARLKRVGADLLPGVQALVWNAFVMLICALLALGSELGARGISQALSVPVLVLAFQQTLSLVATLARGSWIAVSMTLAERAALRPDGTPTQAAEI